MRRFLTLILGILLPVVSLTACKNNSNNMTQTSTQNNGDAVVDIVTSLGNIKVRLFGDTPRHRDNFLKLAEQGFYDGVLFHRVINDFMVQSGDPDSKKAAKGKMLGEGDPGYTIEAEIVYPRHFHRKGVLAAARTSDDVNPERRSSGSQFYIVTGKVFNDSTLRQMEHRMLQQRQQDVFRRLQDENRDTIMSLRRARDHEGLEALRQQLIERTESEVAQNPPVIPDEVREAYRTVGGTPHLDGAYTVFGEVLEGMDVVDAIQKVKTDRADRPLEDVKIISMKVEK